MLRDRIVCGINDDAIQRRLLAEPGLDYAKAVETARNMEAAARSMKELKSGTPSASGHASGGSTAPQPTVHRASSATISQESGLVSGPGPTCYRCGVKGHIAAKCTVDKKVVCHQCGKRGHIRRACKAKPNRVGGKGKSRTVCQVHMVSCGLGGFCSLRRSASSPIQRKPFLLWAAVMSTWSARVRQLSCHYW